jgi:hypothetical protein
VTWWVPVATPAMTVSPRRVKRRLSSSTTSAVAVSGPSAVSVTVVTTTLTGPPDGPAESPQPDASSTATGTAAANAAGRRAAEVCVIDECVWERAARVR